MKSLRSCREATASDLPEVLKLYAQLEMDNGNLLPLADAECILKKMGRYPDYKLYVAVSDGRIIGSYTILIMDNLGHLGAPSAIIEDVVVDPELQGQGIGKMMMGHALNVVGKKGCYKAMLSSNIKREQAHAFYESIGFERHGYSFIVRTAGEQKTVDGL